MGLRSGTSGVFHAPLACPRCGGELRALAEDLRCQQCSNHWAIENGIPRFFAPNYYWGEVSQGDASSLLAEARRNGWKAAVCQRFSDEPDMLYAIMNWQQRASWLALLGLNDDATALDIGSGYGAITHALAKTARQVYSVEAMTERIEFTNERMRQEGLTNVQLIQASALHLPLAVESLDLIVVNGVLEWLGEWDLEDSPRTVQLRFLQKLHHLLKPGGSLVIGIENRIGYNLFCGANDHTGLPFTSLMPRSLATLTLHLVRKSHRRTQLNEKRQYRVYTYSEFGYRKILRESGFQSPTFYWAVPGYNQPRILLPLTTSALAAQTRRAISHPSPDLLSRVRKRLRLRLSQAGLFRPFVPEFVILANKRGVPGSYVASLHRHLTEHLPSEVQIANPVYCVSGGKAGNKCVIRIYDSKDTNRQVIAKAAAPTQTAVDGLSAEFRNLTFLSNRLAQEHSVNLFVPRPLASFTAAGWHFTVESAAPGQQLGDVLISLSRRQQTAFFRAELVQCALAAVNISRILSEHNDIGPTDARWFDIPESARLDPEIRRLLAAQIEKCTRSSFRAHGDFTIENIFWEKSSRRITVVDWQQPVQGVPFLYDVFTLLLSSLPALALDEGRRADAENRFENQFLTAFFHPGASASLTRDFLQAYCAFYPISRQDIWGEFLLSLLMRSNYFLARQSAFGPQYLRLLKLAVRLENDFAFPQD